MSAKDLSAFLANAQTASGPAPVALQGLIAQVAEVCASIATLVAGGALSGALGSRGTENVQGEVQKELDVIIAGDSKPVEFRNVVEADALPGKGAIKVTTKQTADAFCKLAGYAVSTAYVSAMVKGSNCLSTMR